MKLLFTVSGIAFILLTIIIFSSCRPAGLIYTEDGKIECGGDGKAIILTNNATAADPTFDELIAFIQADQTDTRQYISAGPDAFVCADFAEAVHNNAEAAGIRAAWVSLTFEGTKEGHALNAFETTDKGLVYIDCTNSGSKSSPGKATRTWDAIAYIEKGNTYGVLTIERVLAAPYYYDPLEYDYFSVCEKAWLEYETKLKAYNEEVDRFNRENGSRVFVFGTTDAGRMLTWKEELAWQEKELESLQEKTSGHWLESEYSSYLVKNVIIHW